MMQRDKGRRQYGILGILASLIESQRGGGHLCLGQVSHMTEKRKELIRVFSKLHCYIYDY